MSFRMLLALACLFATSYAFSQNSSVDIGLNQPAQLLRPVGSGDEFEYISKDLFGTKNRFLVRVKSIDISTGSVEEFFIGGKPLGEFLFDGTPSLLDVPTDSIFMFSPFWNGDHLDQVRLLGYGLRCRRIEYMEGCRLASVKDLGDEVVTVPAGKFESRKISLFLTVESQFGSGSLEFVIWYSKNLKHIVRQTVKGQHYHIVAELNRIAETIELNKFRPVAH